MELRHYCSDDCAAMADLFYHTVHTVNARDYSQKQLDAWATGRVDLKAWDKSFLEHDTWVALEGDLLVGFADMDKSGYLDRIYIHKNHQGRGIATMLCDRLEQRCPSSCFTTHASITAKPFFEKRGYRVVKEQQVSRGGVFLTNYVMEKTSDRSFSTPLVK